MTTKKIPPGFSRLGSSIAPPISLDCERGSIVGACLAELLRWLQGDCEVHVAVNVDLPPSCHLLLLSPLSNLLTTNVGPGGLFAPGLFDDDTGTVSPSHASSSRDGGLGSAGPGQNILCGNARYGAFASNDGGIGALAGLEGMR
jgi:hypothetical protein